MTIRTNKLVHMPTLLKEGWAMYMLSTTILQVCKPAWILIETKSQIMTGVLL